MCAALELEFLHAARRYLLGGAAPNPEWNHLMFEADAELSARAELCIEQARAAMDAAETSSRETCRAEHLKIALEWLKLASEIRALIPAVNYA
jgi:hypothetical protein